MSRHGHRRRGGPGARSSIPAPTPASLQACDDIRLTSVIAAPLIARGQLLGVMSLALS